MDTNIFEEYAAFIFRVQSTTLPIQVYILICVQVQVYIPEYILPPVKQPHM
jgi:hypothetical protein